MLYCWELLPVTHNLLRLTPEQRTEIDSIANKVLETTGVPSVSLAVVKDGKIAYTQAYGDARLEPKLAATTQMAYSIGSISKQFTATAVMMLQQQGKLSLDDKVGKWLPDLTRANDITLRQVLSMTSGYQDYAPQDYMIPDWEKPISAQQILDRWARIPLDFEPGTKWQYSNTNYVVAGVIVEKVSGQPCSRLSANISSRRWVWVARSTPTPRSCRTVILRDTSAMRWVRCVPLRTKGQAGCLPPAS